MLTRLTRSLPVRLSEAVVARGRAKLLPSLPASIAELLLTRPEARFVQIGAHDGASGDPLHAFIKSGRLRGLLVEAQPEVYARLRQTYAQTAGLTMLNLVVSTSETAPSVLFYRIKPEFHAQIPGADQLSGLTPRVIERALRGRFSNIDAMIETVDLPAAPLMRMLAEHAMLKANILCIDAEGSDAAILASIDFARFKPAIIHYEWCHLPLAEHARTLRMLIDQGYAVARTGNEVLAVQRCEF